MIKRIITYICFAVLSVTFIQAQQCREIEGLTMYSKILKQDIHYSVILPVNYYQSKKLYPVVYMFHGIGGDSSSWLEYGNATNEMDELTKNGEIEPFIAIMPEGYSSYYSNSYDGSFNYESMLTTELIPLVNATYRTHHEPQYNATLGFSMGGFGALSVGLRHKELFGSVVSLSASIRTDKQYINEQSPEWDKQWGRIFGGVGLIGQDRLTTYYLEHSPYHILKDMKLEDLKDFSLFFDIGDKEETLCRSNEELHIMLLEKKIPHIWRVRDGGHDFKTWCSTLPDAFRFLNAKFTGKTYQPVHKEEAIPDKSASDYKFDTIGASHLYMPGLGYATCRSFPIIYVMGNVTFQTEQNFVQRYNKMLEENKVTPLILCFINGNNFNSSIHQVENKYKCIRSEQRMRGAICIESASDSLMAACTVDNLFSASVLVNIREYSQKTDNLAYKLSQQRRYTRLWIDVDSQSGKYAKSSLLHVAFREANLKHEFRAREEGAGDIKSNLEEWIQFINNRFHD